MALPKVVTTANSAVTFQGLWPENDFYYKMYTVKCFIHKIPSKKVSMRQNVIRKQKKNVFMFSG